MELFSNQISDIQKFVPVDSTLEVKSLEPYEQEVKNAYLLDWLGEEQYNDLADNFNSLDEKQTKLLTYVQRVMANFVVLYYLDIAISIGNSGASRVESENQKTPYKYQMTAAQERCTKSGWNAIETMLKFLHKNKNDYPKWKDSEAMKRSRSILINTYAEFRAAYHVVNGRWVFEGLRAVMDDIELLAIKPTIGTAYYNSLKSEILDDTLSDANKKALKFIQKAVAYLTIEQAIAQKIGVIRNNTFVFTESTGDDAMQQITKVVGSMSKKLNAHTMGNRYLTYVKQFLIENLSDYPDFATHHNAKVEAQAAKPVIEPKDRKIVVL